MKKIIISLLILFVSTYTYSQQPDITLYGYSGEPTITAVNSVTLKNGFHAGVGSNLRIFITAVPAVSSAPSSNKNYLLTRTFRTSVKLAQLGQVRNIDQENQIIQYFDGHSRPSQTVALMASPQFRDIIQHIEYDNFGRQSKSYLPYAESSSANGSYRTDASIMQGIYYKEGASLDPHVAKTAKPYAQTVFENSVLNRIKESGAPGEMWQPATSRSTTGGRTVITDYGTNITDDVLLWIVNAAGASSTTYYSAGTLSKIITKDENWINTNVASAPPSKTGTVEEYKDLGGRTVLRRIWQDEIKKLETYYVYDQSGLLRYVLPPKFTGTDFRAETTDPNFYNYIHAYKYDKRRRIAEKKLPGKGWQWIVYNGNNLPVMTQEASQREKKVKEWSYIKYDAFNRVTETGILTANYGDQVAAQKASDAYAASSGEKYWEERTIAVNPGTTPVYTKYTRQTFPVENLNPLQVNYYDDHKFEGANVTGLGLSGLNYVDKNKTFLTGTKVYKDDGSSPLLTIFYYDVKGRLIQSASQNNLGGTERITFSYNYVGELLTSTRLHTVGNKTTKIVAKNKYDHVGRLLDSKHQINEQAEVILIKNEYNEIGQLRQKKLHSENNGLDFLNSLDYTYNERGWIRSVSSPHFSYRLNYNVNSANKVLANAQYNGNIAEQLWGYGTSTANTYTYGYDRLNRLTSAVSTGTVMKEFISYDEMGNITNLNRDGHASGTTYNYTGNQLKSLTGQIATKDDYKYDANGNVTRDRRGMLFTYNYLNQPITAKLPGTSVAYQYDAVGTKLRRTDTVGGIISVQDYIGGIEYKKIGNSDPIIETIQTSVGYLQNNAGIYTYHYNSKDHLGNVRATLQRTSTNVGTVIQKHDYYAFGKSKSILVSGNNKYLYNGKEIQETLGGQYDYGARFYDAEIARWNVMDPMAEIHYGYTSYAYVLNNPLKYIDPFGLDTMNNNNKFTSDQWKNFDTKKDVIGLNEITVNAPYNFYGGFGNSYGFGNFVGNSGLGRFNNFNANYTPRPVVTSSSTTPFNRSPRFGLSMRELITNKINQLDINGKIVDGNLDAVGHYYMGNGEPATIGKESLKRILLSNVFIQKHLQVMSGGSDANFGMNFTNLEFHIGRTSVSAFPNPFNKTVTYTLFEKDGFWDPDFIFERLNNSYYLSPNFVPDGVGPNLERGGTPYKYNTTTISIPYY